MGIAQAVVVLLSAEDGADLISSLCLPDDDPREKDLTGQPHSNVLIEAGMALGTDPDRTILVELGPIRRASDLAGFNVVHLSNESISRLALRGRLRAAGCAVQGTQRWFDHKTGGDFDGAALPDATNLEAAESKVPPALRRRHLQEALEDLEREEQDRRAELDHAERSEIDQIGHEYTARGTFSSSARLYTQRQVREHFEPRRASLDRELRATRRRLEEELATLEPADEDGAA